MVVVGDGAVVILLKEAQVAAIVVGERVGGIELDRLVVVGERMVALVLLEMAVGAVVVDEREASGPNSAPPR